MVFFATDTEVFSQVRGDPLAWTAMPVNTVFPNQVDMIAGDFLLASSDTEMEHGTVTYTKKAELQVFRDGVYSVKFDMKIASVYGDPANYVRGRIYKDGVAYGTEWNSTTDANYATFTEDLTFEAGDLIQLYIRESAGGSPNVFIRNFRIYTGAHDTPLVTVF